MARPINPYIAGKPLWDRERFFGREDILEWVERELQNLGTNALVLFGQRRIGKTSILLQLQQTLPHNIFLPVYFDLQDQATRPLGQVLADLADTVTEEAGFDPPDPTAFDDQGRYFSRTFLPKLEKELGTERRLVFLLDEFDVLDQVAEKELASTTAAKAFFPFLRSLMIKDSWRAFVFIVGRRAEDLTLNFTTTFKASLVRELWVLDQASAEQLIGQAVTNNTLQFTDSAVNRILSLSNRHPYLTQLLCQRTWEQAYRAKPITPPLIDIENVEEAVPDVLKSGEQALIWLWNGLTPAEKIYAAALAEIAAEEKTISEEQVIQVLATHAARLRTREVELASRDLVKRRVLELAGEQAYRFSIELFRRWVHTNKPLRDVKDEIDQIDPVAEQLFKVGREEFRRREWEQATRYFKDALGRNSKHFRARLYLGESLLELGQIDSAVAELEQAYQLDQDQAKFALVRGLLSQARVRDKASNEEGVLAVCKRILVISANEREALALRTAIWTRRGDAALAKNDLEAALSAYQIAGDHEKMAQVQAEVEILRKRQAQLKTQAQAHVKGEEWKEAAATYEQLIAEAPDQESRSTWEQELKRCQEEQELAIFFAQGLEAMQPGKWVQAQQAFLQVVNRRVTYQKNGRWATELLHQATKRAL